MSVEEMSKITKALAKHGEKLSWMGRVPILSVLTEITNPPAVIDTILSENVFPIVNQYARVIGEMVDLLDKVFSSDLRYELVEALWQGTPLPKGLPADFDVEEVRRRIESGKIGYVKKTNRSLSI